MKPYYQNSNSVIYCGDNAKLLKVEAIAFVVAQAIVGRTRDNQIDGLGFKRCEALAPQLIRVLKTGGYIVWIVGDQTKDGSESEPHEDIVIRSLKARLQKELDNLQDAIKKLQARTPIHSL